jgi:hypothetical protein
MLGAKHNTEVGAERAIVNGPRFQTETLPYCWAEGYFYLEVPEPERRNEGGALAPSKARARFRGGGKIPRDNSRQAKFEPAREA